MDYEDHVVDGEIYVTRGKKLSRVDKILPLV